MKILLAGYNVDTDVLEDLKKNSPSRADITPETLSAAYARISRDPRPINELRAAARAEVEKARKSNSAIIFKMGHHSVAEHAVFNFDIIGVSRLALECLEKFRLASYTEKSQRYITLGSDFYVPEEIKRSIYLSKYQAVIKKQNAMYHELFEKLKAQAFKKHASLAADPKNHNLLEGWAKEDARYVTSLATLGQLGMTINARNLEYLFRRFASQSLSEVKAIGQAMYKLASGIAPSIILFVEANAFDQKTYSEIEAYVDQNLKFSAGKTQAGKTHKNKAQNGSISPVSLVGLTVEADQRILAAILHTVSRRPYAACYQTAQKMPRAKKVAVFKKAFENMQFYDAVLREFEFANLTYEIVISAAGFGQLKRHRMAALTSQPYDPTLGVTVPESICEIGKEKAFLSLVRETEGVYFQIAKTLPMPAQYVLTNAHRRRVLMDVNVRELYHIARLRDDQHAQWDIQNIARQMSRQAKVKMPLAAALLCGKDRFPEVFNMLQYL
ncbi:MAG: FAD-dependent thymidylate synthase [Candidatus Margulisiibacteriota bacterium]